MHPYLFEILGRKVASYGVLMVVGAVAAWFYVRGLSSKANKDIPLVFLVAICGGLIGAFLLRPIMKLPVALLHWEQYGQMTVDGFLSYLFGEIVFYGGLVGGAVGVLLYCGAYKLPIPSVTDVFAPALALGHGIGRIGCFFAGCCYGVAVDASHPFAVVYPPSSLLAPPGIPLLATPLIESACLFALAAILGLAYTKVKLIGLSTALYFVLYAPMRFMLEFFRGDGIRGIYGSFSTSQYISMLLFAVGAVLLCLMLSKQRRAAGGHALCNPEHTDDGGN